MITVSSFLQQKAHDTAIKMVANKVSVSDILDADGFVLIRVDSGFACPFNSTLQVKMSFDGDVYWICEGKAENILAQKE